MYPKNAWDAGLAALIGEIDQPVIAAGEALGVS
jgi:hypothetical protein